MYLWLHILGLAIYLSCIHICDMYIFMSVFVLIICVYLYVCIHTMIALVIFMMYHNHA
jgi:hypothetical protein